MSCCTSMGANIKKGSKDLRKYLRHIKKKKDYYFGKDEYIYRFYDAQYVLLKDLIVKQNGILNKGY